MNEENTYIAPGISINNLTNNPNLKVIEEKGSFTVFEHQQDASTLPYEAQTFYYMHKMGIKRRQLLIKLNNSTAKSQAGAMQWIAGNVESHTGLGSGIKAVGNFLSGLVKGALTGESSVKPHYEGSGFVMLEPTYKHILLEDVSSWASGMVVQDSFYLASDATVEEKVVARKSISSVVAGGEGFFNLSLKGKGIVALECPIPRSEIIEFSLNNGILKIDGNMAIAWSSNLEFTVEKSSKSIIGSLTNKEGLVNVYRGTGKIWLTPTVEGTLMQEGFIKNTTSNGGKSTKGILDSLTSDNN